MHGQYPHSAGFKEKGKTSEDAARAIEPVAETLRAKIETLYRYGAKATPDKIAAALGKSILAVRPRISELVKQGKLKETGKRERNESGQWAHVYEWADQRREPTLF